MYICCCVIEAKQFSVASCSLNYLNVLPGVIICIPQIQHRFHIFLGEFFVYVLFISSHQVSNVIKHIDFNWLVKSIPFLNSVCQWI